MADSPCPETPGGADDLRVYFRQHGVMRSRSVGGMVADGRVHLPPLPQRLRAACADETRALPAGAVDPLDLPRARSRWPGYRQCVQAAADWASTRGLPDLGAGIPPALMACRGARYHLDAGRYGAKAFLNLFLEDDKSLDLHFPAAGRRIALTLGTVVLFDTGQPHAVVERGRSAFDADAFETGQDRTLLFLSWELPIDDAAVARVLGVQCDVAAATAAVPMRPQVRRGGRPARLCPASGRWL